MSIKSDSDETLHGEEDFDFHVKAYELEPTTENFDKVKYYKPRSPNEITYKRTIFPIIKADYEARQRFHPLANLFPLLSSEDSKNLAEDIRKNGLLNDIIELEDQILDGRNRLLACIRAGVKPRFKQFDLKIDPLTYVLSENLHRRHLNTAQRAEIAVKVHELEKINAKHRRDQTTKLKRNEKGQLMKDPGGDQRSLTGKKKKNSTHGKSMVKTAKKFDIGYHTLRKVNKIKKAAKTNPEIAAQWEKAKKGETPISKVYELIDPKSPKKPSKDPDIDTIRNVIDYLASLEIDPYLPILARNLRTRFNFVVKQNETLSGMSLESSTSTKKMENN